MLQSFCFDIKMFVVGMIFGEFFKLVCKQSVIEELDRIAFMFECVVLVDLSDVELFVLKVKVGGYL